MKLLTHRSKHLSPLASSICALLAIAHLAALAEKPAPRRAAAPPLDRRDEPAAPRSPDTALDAGLDYLLSQQHADGGWGQGGGWRQGGSKGGGRVEGANVEDPSDLGNTCVSLVTLLRSGKTADAGRYRDASLKALAFICTMIERADTESLYATDVRDTQLQTKIGAFVDTFLAGWALSELKLRAPAGADEARCTAALEKIVSKIERNQKADGSFEGNRGWAAVLSQGLASKALNAASRSGVAVSKSALDKDQMQNREGLDVAQGAFVAPAAAAAEPSSAGVSLYRESAKLGGLREKVKSNLKRKAEAGRIAADPQAPAPAKQQAALELKEIQADEKAAQVAADAVSGKLRDATYVAGFGNNGGEEFLSYLNLTESMHERGGKEWADWRAQMARTLCGAQNQDGSWAGQHCITGRTFCTAGALLTLLVEKTAEAGTTTSVAPQTTKPVAAQ